MFGYNAQHRFNRFQYDQRRLSISKDNLVFHPIGNSKLGQAYLVMRYEIASPSRVNLKFHVNPAQLSW